MVALREFVTLKKQQLVTFSWTTVAEPHVASSGADQAGPFEMMCP